MHKIVSERIGRIEGIQSSESFIEMKSRMKAMPYMPSKDSVTSIAETKSLNQELLYIMN